MAWQYQSQLPGVGGGGEPSERVNRMDGVADIYCSLASVHAGTRSTRVGAGRLQDWHTCTLWTLSEAARTELNTRVRITA